MSISIIIPLYNVEQYILACLSSVVNQTCKSDNIECIVVDDCSPDQSASLVERFIYEYQGKIRFMFIHHEENKGLSEARNTGIKAASGDYVYFLDSDDEIKQNCLELLTMPLKTSCYDFVVANHEVICDWSDMNLSLGLPEGPVMSKLGIIDSFHRGWFTTAWNKLVRREFLIDNNIYFKSGILHEDELWSFQLACYANTMYVVNERTYIYYIRTGSIMSDLRSRRHFDSYTEVLKGQVLTVADCGLENNDNLYNIIEEGKLCCMKYATKLLSCKESFAYYNGLRTIVYPRQNKYKCSTKKELLRELQYKILPVLGYSLVVLLNKVSDLLVAYRHKKEMRNYGRKYTKE